MLGWLFAWRRTLIRRRVVVNLADTAFTGIIWARRGPLLVLRDVAIISQPGAPAQPMDGEVVLERSRVEFIQVVG